MDVNSEIGRKMAPLTPLGFMLIFEKFFFWDSKHPVLSYFQSPSYSIQNENVQAEKDNVPICHDMVQFVVG